jgi:hypothetical protein
MEFFIRKDSLEPILKMQLIQDYYRWQPSDVMDVGRYQGQFLIEFLTEGSQLVAPVREDLFINIQESFGIL